MNVAIIDDDDDDREILCDGIMAVAPDSHCIFFSDGVKALQHLRTSLVTPDFIFLDIYMHQMDGKDCLLKIRSIKSLLTVPVIMYSGTTVDAREIDVYKKLGASQFIVKPNSIADLTQILKQVLNV